VSAEENRRQLEGGRAFALAGLAEYATGSIVSRTLRQTGAGSLTCFAFEEGQQLSEHTSPFDAYVQVLDGEAVLTIGGTDVAARTGDIVLMPGGVPHAVRGNGRFKMLLTMYKS
jgi:quercetin dioxygenase-like cupin family protein